MILIENVLAKYNVVRDNKVSDDGWGDIPTALSPLVNTNIGASLEPSLMNAIHQGMPLKSVNDRPIPMPAQSLMNQITQGRASLTNNTERVLNNSITTPAPNLLDEIKNGIILKKANPSNMNTNNTPALPPIFSTLASTLDRMLIKTKVEAVNIPVVNQLDNDEWQD